MTGRSRAILLLTADGIRRLLREGLVLRSLVFPVALTVFTVTATVAVVIGLQPPTRLALTREAADEAFVSEIEAEGWTVVLTDDPGRLVRDGTAAVGTDGKDLWIGAEGFPPLDLEARVRARLGTVWRPDEPRRRRVARIRESDAPRRLAVFLGALFALYGVVFGAGSIARDKDEGTLDAELALPLPHWFHGASRWLAGTTVLGGFFGFSVYLLHAIMGIPDAANLAAKGLAAAGLSTAIGILVIGRAGLDRGFAGPMSGGLVAVFSLLPLGLTQGPAATWLPVASLLSASTPAWPSLLTALASGALAAFVFSRRTAVS